ncbi:16S rRNA (guanine(527)-N(7))-methyltransferase RsmG [candidate division KSB1 bacterium]|nr:16S rRNA (guanine(527)-N(7))-methyltransferase RsmG [candidate division KSB1 bacterium]RQW06559.1 MAG: 16S rRNA (guanine(527)-N(7))-methyltransferase RsmG [candidate division KSB1 bacterium]
MDHVPRETVTMLKSNEIAVAALARDHALTTEQTQQFVRYVELIERWSERMRLVSTSDLGRIVSRHIAESLAVLRHQLIPDRGALLDVGSGAGFPGIPIAVCLSELRVTLLDSQRKKMLFLQEAAETMQLKNVTVIGDRLQNLPAQQAYDAVTARAVARARLLWAWSCPHLRKDGLLIVFKGGRVDDEIEELLQTYAVSCRVLPLFPDGDAAERKLVVLSRR